MQLTCHLNVQAGTAGTAAVGGIGDMAVGKCMLAGNLDVAFPR